MYDFNTKLRTCVKYTHTLQDVQSVNLVPTVYTFVTVLITTRVMYLLVYVKQLGATMDGQEYHAKYVIKLFPRQSFV